MELCKARVQELFSPTFNSSTLRRHSPAWSVCAQFARVLCVRNPHCCEFWDVEISLIPALP